MMGGEFCGNATCALGWVLSDRDNFLHGFIEVSGKEEPVLVSIVADKVKMEVPTTYNMRFADELKSKIIIKVEGITHVICTQPPPVDVYAEARKILNDLGLINEEAAGVLYTEPYKDGVSITPVVWVRDTSSLMKEGACASGSICVAIWQAVVRKSEVVNLPVYQPSGSIIHVSAKINGATSAKTSIINKVMILEESELIMGTQL
jgi:diaminopimelate epimerase